MTLFGCYFRKQSLLWALGDAERAKALPKHHRSDKLSKQDKIDKLEKLEMMERSERVDHLDALMLKKISGMDLDEEVRLHNSIVTYKYPRNFFDWPLLKLGVASIYISCIMYIAIVSLEFMAALQRLYIPVMRQ